MIYFVFSIFGITVIVFLISNVVPVDPIYSVLGDQADILSPEQIRQMKQVLGLDRPLHEQYVAYLRRLLQGDLGMSLFTQKPVSYELATRFPATLELAIIAFMIMLAIGVPVGIFSAVKKDTAMDTVARIMSLTGLAIPSFFLALLLLLAFYVNFGWIEPFRLSQGMPSPPAVTGMFTIDSLLAGKIDVFLDALRHIIAPAFVLGFSASALISRLTRASMLEVLGQDYIRTAKVKGLVDRVITYKHALRNALIPTVTQAGVSLGSLFSGAVITETVFSWPGVGGFAAKAALSFDFPSIMGVAILIATIFVSMNLVVDLLYGYLDPRIRVE